MEALEFCVNGNLDGLGRNPRRIQMYLYIVVNCMILAELAFVTCLTMCTGTLGDVNANGDGLVGCSFFSGNL